MFSSENQIHLNLNFYFWTNSQIKKQNLILKYKLWDYSNYKQNGKIIWLTIIKLIYNNNIYNKTSEFYFF